MLTSGCKSSPAQYKRHYYLAPTRTKLKLCKPLFIVHGRLKGFFKVMLQYKNSVPKVGVPHA